MPLLRRFLVIQALMLWQGGFLFYAAIVVPTGTEVLDTFSQGRVTRHVTDSMNLIGAVTVCILAWDQRYAKRKSERARWIAWSILSGGLVALALIHPQIERQIDFGPDGRIVDYAAFYLWHRVYLYIATLQWVTSLVYVVLMLRIWYSNRANGE